MELNGGMNGRIGIHYLEQLTSAFSIFDDLHIHDASRWACVRSYDISLDSQKFIEVALLTRCIQLWNRLGDR